MADNQRRDWSEYEKILERGFTGQIVLHCDKGEVMKYELREVRHPKQACEESEKQVT